MTFRISTCLFLATLIEMCSGAVALGSHFGLPQSLNLLSWKVQEIVALEQMKNYVVLCNTKARLPGVSIRDYLADGM